MLQYINITQTGQRGHRRAQKEERQCLVNVRLFMCLDYLLYSRVLYRYLPIL